MKPAQFGPISAMSSSAHRARSLRSASLPSSVPTSEYPLAYTTAPPAPLAAACRRISSTVFRGVHTTTRSMSSGRDSSEGQHFLPNTASRPGLMK